MEISKNGPTANRSGDQPYGYADMPGRDGSEKMKQKRILLIPLLLIVLMAVIGSVSADYSFRVPRTETIVMLEQDGSMTVSVEYQFENLGQKLDYIDIGLPNNNYTLSDIQVSLNGAVNKKIKVTKADYQQSGLRYGITLEMGSESIANGESGTVSVIIPNIRKNLYDATSETIDEQEIDYVGFEFSPNYFGEKFVKGATDYSFMIVFPDGATSEQVYYYTPKKWPGNEAPDAWVSDGGRIVYNWVYKSADAHTEYIFGGKFPKSVLTSTSNIVVPSSGNTSSSIMEWWEPIVGVLVCFLPIVGVIISIVNKIRKPSGGQRTRLTGRSYLPPQIKTDGEGIKRGLTAVEAAILLEVDLERVISMILYGLSKKEVISIKSQDPFEAEIADPLPESLYDYERNFIEAIQQPDLTGKRRKMRDMLQRLILSVTKKMEGFSLEETREYYKSICDKAWSQVEAAETPELKSKMLGDHFGWAMLEEEPEKKIEQTFSSYEMIPPTWWWRVDPGYRRPVSFPSSSPSSSSSEGGSGSEKRSGSSSSSKPAAMPVLPGAMFARSITNSAKGLGTSMVGNMSQFKTSVKNRTNPAPVSSSGSHHSSSGGGSSSCACACACACAGCACACAGGGR